MKITIKPAKGLKVPDPFSGGYLPEEGRTVEDAPYWRRLLKYRNVIPVPAASAKPAPAKQKPRGKK